MMLLEGVNGSIRRTGTRIVIIAPGQVETL